MITDGLPRFSNERPRRSRAALLQLCLNLLDQSLGGKVRCIQIGANDGSLADPIAPMLASPGWSGLLIEPHPAYFRALSDRYGAQDGIRLRQVAISERRGTAELYALASFAADFYPAWAQGCASFDRAWLESALREGARKTGARFEPSHIEVVEVPVEPLSSLLSAEGVKHADLLVIDVEGHELPVLSSFDPAALGLSLAIVECQRRRKDDAQKIAAVLKHAGLTPIRLGNDIVALHPDRLKLPLADVAAWLGYAPLQTDEVTRETE